MSSQPSRTYQQSMSSSSNPISHPHPESPSFYWQSGTAHPSNYNYNGSHPFGVDRNHRSLIEPNPGDNGHIIGNGLPLRIDQCALHRNASNSNQIEQLPSPNASQSYQFLHQQSPVAPCNDDPPRFFSQPINVDHQIGGITPQKTVASAN
ncbi:uncharacterized protein MELLADRAFT_89532 [Melampsora larici-populina 98AG31]|uniref:Uncharacterized protein n=1 Tax=Melampsora larici-populina (strain 98AG31 / pathotype 3-4-7) TaxID=747676 RepID=F4RTQ2_MELLP|nr:uncharacterized protein MELLADRAFT_89532 [Melampsora larici-populina 98AG31]EGG04297.1 hypothetical protein MELLADRAFT_89532 [Melampsora larici-populina 98AG31]